MSNANVTETETETKTEIEIETETKTDIEIEIHSKISRAMKERNFGMLYSLLMWNKTYFNRELFVSIIDLCCDYNYDGPERYFRINNILDHFLTKYGKWIFEKTVLTMMKYRKTNRWFFDNKLMYHGRRGITNVFE